MGTRSKLGVNAAIAVACLILAPSASAGAWLPVQNLSKAGRDATNTAIAMDAAGGTTAIWEKDNDTSFGFHGEVSTRNPNEAFSAPAELGPGITDPQVEMTPGGRAIAIWKRLKNPPGVYVIEAAEKAPGGSFGAPTTVAELPSSVIPNGLTTSSNASGEVVVAWTRRDPDSAVDKTVTFVEAAVGSIAAGFAEPEPVSPAIVAEQSATEPTVAIDGAGEAIAAWRYDDGTNEVLEASERPAGGSAVFGAPEVVSGAGTDSFGPDIAMTADGEAVLVWREEEGTESSIQFSGRPVGGSEFGPGDELSEEGTDVFGPRIALSPNGDGTVVWNRTEEEVGVIQAARRSGGRVFAGPVDLNSGEAVGPGDISLAIDDAGNEVVAWSGTAGGFDRVVKAVVSQGGGAYSSPAEISATSPDFLHPRAAIDDVGNATVIWTRSDGLNLIAQVAGYDASPPQIRGLSVPATGMVGVPVAFSSAPFDVWPIASSSFSFGDGTGAPGTSASHTYSAPGVYQVTATAVDAAGVPASASGAIAISPSYEFSLGKQKRNAKKGTATLTVAVSGPGAVALTGKTVKRASKRASAAGSVVLSVVAKGKAKKQLAKKGKAKVKVSVSFSPDGGDHAASKSATVTLKKTAPKRSKK